MEKIASNLGITPPPIRRLAKKHNSIQEYKRKWPADQEKYSEALKKKILARLRYGPPEPLYKIHKEFEKDGVTFMVVLNLAKKFFSTEEYKKRWIATKDLIPDEVRDKIKFDILYHQKLNATDIAQKYGIALNTVRKIAIDEVFSGDTYAYKTRFPQKEASGLGMVVHQKTRELLTAFFKSISIRFYSEIIIFPYSNVKSDGVLINIDDIRQRARIMGISFSEEIEMVMFDYTNDSTKKNILKKITKYQHKKIMFFIIGMKWPSWWKKQVKEPPNEKVVKFKRNIRVISPNIFANLIGLNGKYLKVFQDILTCNYNWDVDALDQIDLSNLRYNTVELQRDFNFSGFFSDSEERQRKRQLDLINKKKNQLNLDEFI